MTASWPKLIAEPLKAPGDAALLSVYHSGADYYLITRSNGRIEVLHMNEGTWEKVILPEEIIRGGPPVLVSRDKDLAFTEGNIVHWQKDGAWRRTKVTFPTSWKLDRDGNPLGKMAFIKQDHLYASSNAGEFGSFFGSYDLINQEGSWHMIWNGGLPVVHLFEDSKRMLWAFASLGHRMSYQYSLNRRVPRWEAVIDISTTSIRPPGKRVSPLVLQKDSMLIDAAPMPDGGIALLERQDGVYLRASGECPRFIAFEPGLLSSLQPGAEDYYAMKATSLCFDSVGNVYVRAPRGVLVFHKEDASGPWRVRQIKYPD